MLNNAEPSNWLTKEQLLEILDILYQDPLFEGIFTPQECFEQ